MRNTISGIIRSRFLFASPWLLAAAAGLLVIIVVIFAFHNLRLEKRLMTNALLQKTLTLMRAVHSASRVSLIADMGKGYWQSDPWYEHVQKVIQHLADDHDVVEMVIVDGQGRIVAHSEREKINTVLSHLHLLEKAEQSAKRNKLFYSIDTTSEGKRIIRAIRPFQTIFPVRYAEIGRSRMPRRHHFFTTRDDLHPPLVSPQHRDTRHFIIIGLDMSAFDKAVGRLQVQLIMLSAVMLLIGLAGWLSLSMIQGYRVSQQTLNKIQAFTSLLIAKLPVGIIATDPKGRVATWNQVVAEMTGIPQADAIDRPPAALLPPDMAAFLTRRTGLEGGGYKEQELEAQFQETTFVLMCRTICILDSEQRYMGTVLLLSDVSEVKMLEQKIRENERLAAIGKMAGGVAHEIRNPLSSIKGLALLLKNQFTIGSKEQNAADLLIQETERMNRTITEMLSLTRPMSLHITPLHIGQLLTKCLEFLNTECANRGVAVELWVEDNLPLVRGDTDRLNQVCMNIFLNSLQAMESGGTLMVSARQSNADPSQVCITIRDTGEGMDRETLRQVFYPYFTTKAQGTGIGLAITQKIMADHHGKITIESRPKEGTTVRLMFPIEQ
ncbi:MAG: hypothetical protein CSA33_07630 [Desulfobulbus propionicus]|nr:MAG: hypothetical protein CSA33_07630 [Desulfobulbus propionicus]